MSDTAILVFARAPVPGAVKTRLSPGLSAAQACLLYRHLLVRTVRTAVASNLGPVTLCCWPDTGDPCLQALSTRLGVRLRKQQGADLGERMHRALRESLRTAPGVILIGTDCPGMTPELLGDAATALAAGNRAVFAPAADGGYVLVGLRGAEPALFRDIPWGGTRVMAMTRRRLLEIGCQWHELPMQRDIDRVQDLDLLPPDLRGWGHRAPEF